VHISCMHLAREHPSWTDKLSTGHTSLSLSFLATVWCSLLCLGPPRDRIGTAVAVHEGRGRDVMRTGRRKRDMVMLLLPAALTVAVCPDPIQN
jgi:hypothetical protein